MSNFNQSDVVRIVESVLPDIQRTGNAQGALVKRATELNLPPSVLEKCGHVFNTAKTLNYLDRVDSTEKRGSSFQTLDVDALINEYTSFKPDSNELWSKAATADLAASVDFSAELDPFASPDEAYEKAANSSTTSSFIHEDRHSEAWARVHEKQACERNLEQMRSVYRHFREEATRKSAAILDALELYYSPISDTALLERESARLFGAERAKRAFDFLTAQAAFRPVSAERMKRAAEDAPPAGLVRHGETHDMVGSLVEAVELLRVSGEELEKAAGAFNENFGTNFGDALNDATLKKKEDESDKVSDVGANKGKIEKKKREKKEEKKEESGSGPKLPVIGETISRVRERTRAFGGDLDSLIGLFTTTDNERQTDIDTAATLARAEAALNTLLLVDPVISEYDEEEVRNVFFTVLNTNPEVATDINQLRGVLRTAGDFGNVVDIDAVLKLKKLRHPTMRSDKD